MDDIQIKEAIRNTLSVVFEIPEEDVTEESSTDSIENWDSIRHLNLIIALEEQFGVSIPDDDVGNMLNFKIIKIVISEAINGK
ncbi:MAG: acyl carrier protein [Bacteroidetes bacterium]|nr:acyl carrier protein [Bacteroidota bacterium]MDA1119611.1 acyl carrier protein [Bacteroidota bacterium]